MDVHEEVGERMSEATFRFMPSSGWVVGPSLDREHVRVEITVTLARDWWAWVWGALGGSWYSCLGGIGWCQRQRHGYHSKEVVPEARKEKWTRECGRVGTACSY